MKHYATQTSITSGQRKQYLRFVEDAGERALDESGTDNDGIQRLIERGGKFQAYVVAGIRRFTADVPDYDIARSILGDDFISPEEISEARGLTYAEDQLIELGKKLPDQAALEWCRENGYMLVAGPPQPMSLLEIRAIHPDYFYSKGSDHDDEGWYDNSSEQFSRTDKVEALTWIAFRKDPVKGSLSKDWPEQRALVTEPVVIPNAAETVWVLTTYKAVRGIYLLDHLRVRTSSVGSGCHRVHVGRFDRRGLHVNYYWADRRSDRLGVAASRKF